MSLLIRDARLGTPSTARNAAGRASLRIEGERIEAIAPELAPLPGETVIDARGRVLLPGFVDAHTHAAFAGDRLDEFELSLQGKSYLEILAAGGGILSTVRAVRRATRAELCQLLGERLQLMLAHGTTTVEVKSGYGLTTADELKLLSAIHDAAQGFPGTVVPTALLGHAIDPHESRFVERVIEETLPAVHAEFPGIAVDAFCERGAWSVDECRRLFERARSLGHPLRLHADQFTAQGGLELALEFGALSVDHLEASAPEALHRLAESGTFGVVLPVSSFHTGSSYADARTFLDAGGRLVIATNFNPGSAPCFAMPFALALAVRKLRLTVREAINASSRTAAELLGLSDRGQLTVGSRADLLLLRHSDERALAHELGGNPVERVFVAGSIISCP